MTDPREKRAVSTVGSAKATGEAEVRTSHPPAPVPARTRGAKTHRARRWLCQCTASPGLSARSATLPWTRGRLSGTVNCRTIAIAMTTMVALGR